MRRFSCLLWARAWGFVANLTLHRQAEHLAAIGLALAALYTCGLWRVSYSERRFLLLLSASEVGVFHSYIRSESLRGLRPGGQIV